LEGERSVASSKSRQRKLARAKMERQMARRAAQVRRRRQAWAITVVSVVAVLGIAGTVWAVAFARHKASTSAASCGWNDAGTSNTNLKDVGKPPTTGMPRSGTETMTITTNLGAVTASLDLAKAPCTAASFAYLAGKTFFNNTACHRVVTTGTYLLQCGDPSGTGQGGPRYTYANEYVPTTPAPASSASAGASASAEASAQVLYPAGSIATANQAADLNGSQFFIFYKDSPMPPNYTLFGTVTAGLDVVQQVAAAGDDGSFANQGGGGKPKKTITIQTLTVGATPSPSPSGSAGSPTAPSSATPAASTSSAKS
jgi:peptidyl-prolyl cis-trans isomerase B (cyclophilin B)